MENVATIILAAGKGTRIHANLRNKVLYPLAGKPMIGYTTDTLKATGIYPIVVVVGFKKNKVMEYLGNEFIFIDQGKLLGTGHAVKKAIKYLPAKTKHTLVLNADDSAFYTPQILRKMVKRHLNTLAEITFLTVEKKNPTGYGRIIRDKKGQVAGIQEEKNASVEEQKIKEINTGTYCFSLEFLKKHLTKIKKDAFKGEYYITDLVEIAVKGKLKVETVKIDSQAFFGINTMEELKDADRRMRKKLKL